MTKPYRLSSSASPAAPYVLNTSSPLAMGRTAIIRSVSPSSSWSSRIDDDSGSAWLSMSQNGTMACAVSPPVLTWESESSFSSSSSSSSSPSVNENPATSAAA